MFKNVMVALGLGPDEEYDDRYFDDDDDVVGFNDPDRGESHLDDRLATPAGTLGAADTGRATTGAVGAVRQIRPVTADQEPSFTVRPISRTEQEIEAVTPVVASKPRSIAPQSFGDAKVLADEFKRSTPVIMQLSDVDRELARRLIDFASGVCYSLGGSMEKLANNVFLLLPKGTEVAADERRRIEERGFDR
jgi:cell division inhibitor SepF